METSDCEQLAAAHAGLIRRVAWGYCRGAADRKDLVQEILVQLWRSRSRFDGRAKASTWVQRVALNVAISHLRRVGRRREELGATDVENVSAPADDAAHHAAHDGGADVEALRACIDALEPLDRALVLLHLEGENHAAIGEVLGLSATNVGTKLARLRERLRERLTARERRGHHKETNDGTR